MANRVNLEYNNAYNIRLGAGLRIGASRPAALSGTYTIDPDEGPLIVLDCNGSGRTVLLPAEAEGLFLIITNVSGTAVSATVKEDSNTTTIGTVAQSKTSIFACDGTTWYALTGA